jgi:hypothetical protein
LLTLVATTFEITGAAIVCVPVVVKLYVVE